MGRDYKLRERGGELGRDKRKAKRMGRDYKGRERKRKLGLRRRKQEEFGEGG